jgi:hypothetical protein
MRGAGLKQNKPTRHDDGSAWDAALRKQLGDYF